MEAWENIPRINGFDEFFENVPKEDQTKYNSYGAWENYVKQNFKR